MTLVCVRLEESFNTPRITALADTRATVRRADGSLKTVSDTTVKLFALPIRCYTLDSLTPVTGAWTEPYFETTVGLGFSGHCFEALTVIAHISQFLSALVAPNGDRPTPDADGIVHLVVKLCEGYFSGHSGDGDPVLLLLMFGYQDGRPWIAKITRRSSEGVRSNLTWADANTLETVGQDALFEQRARDWRQRIQAHKASISKKPAPKTEDGVFEKEVELARHELAERKVTEEEMLRQIESEFAEGIGGVLQRLELSLDNGKVVAGFTQDDRTYIGGASYTVSLSGHLGPIPVVEKMGRHIRKP